MCQLVLPCSYPWFQRCGASSLHLYLFLWERFLLPLFLCFFMACKHKLLALSMYVATNSCPNMAVSMASLV